MMMWWWILIPVVLLLAFFLYNGRNMRGTRTRSGENPIDILDNRFAKGEIFKEEYEDQKRALNSKN